MQVRVERQVIELRDGIGGPFREVTEYGLQFVDALLGCTEQALGEFLGASTSTVPTPGTRAEPGRDIPSPGCNRRYSRRYLRSSPPARYAASRLRGAKPRTPDSRCQPGRLREWRYSSPATIASALFEHLTELGSESDRVVAGG